MDLFSGIGGLTIALSEWVIPIAYCENERYAVGVLLSRMSEGKIPVAPIWDDVRTLQGSIFNGMVDIIYGGFPCQDVSVGGLGKGLEGERTGLYREAVRLVSECRPKFVFLENVGGIKKYVPIIRREFEAIGYDCRDGFLSAKEIGANHNRNRWWLLANLDGLGLGEFRKSISKCGRERTADIGSNGKKESMEHIESKRQIWQIEQRVDSRGGSVGSMRSDWWQTEPNVGRVANGIPYAMDRIKGLGNAVVPLQAKTAFQILMGLEILPTVN